MLLKGASSRELGFVSAESALQNLITRDLLKQRKYKYKELI